MAASSPMPLYADIVDRSRSAAVAAEQNCVPNICLLFSPEDAELGQDFHEVLSNQNYCGYYREYVAEPEFLALLNSENHNPQLFDLQHADFIVLILSRGLRASCQNAGIALEALVQSRAFRNKSIFVIASDPDAGSISLPSGTHRLPDDGRSVWAGRKCDFDLLRPIVAKLIAQARFSEQPGELPVPRLTTVSRNWTKALADLARSVPANVFISYSSQNREEVRALIKSLKGLELSMMIHLWSDHRLHTGDDWTQEIECQIGKAHILILLLTMDYLASEPIRKWELPRIMQREGEGARLYPIQARKFSWKAIKWIQAGQFRPRERAIWPATGDEETSLLAEIADEIAEIACWYTWQIV